MVPLLEVQAMNGLRWFLGAVSVGMIAGVVSTGAFATDPPANRSLAERCYATGDMQLAATTDDGAQVFLGEIPLGDVGWNGPGLCLSYQDRNGVTGTTVAPVGATPVGPGVAMKGLDTATGKYVVVAAVQDGYNSVSIRGNPVPVSNNVLVIDARDASDDMTIKGPAGVEEIDLVALGN
jgi:hypothetical protein